MSYRLPKVEQHIRRVLSEFLLKERDHLGIGIVSINGILVSRDLSSARILVSFIAEPDQQQAFHKLMRHAREMQTHLFRNFQVKKVPKIIWELDLDPASAYKIEKLLDDISPTPRENRDFPNTREQSESDSDSRAS